MSEKSVKAYQICAAKNRRGTPCERPAGWGTDHPGEGRCKLHGGKTPVKHGRYSTVKSTTVRKLVERFQEDPDPLNVQAEVALARALLHEWLDRYEERAAQLEAWNAAGDSKGGRPARIPDITEISPLLDLISKIVSRIEKARSDNAISRPDLLRVMGEMGRVVEHHIKDKSVLELIKRDWLSIRL